MIRIIIAAASLAIVTTPALAAPCRDAKGHFVACSKVTHTTTVKTVTKTTSRCRDAKGHFAKCGTPGAKPA